MNSELIRLGAELASALIDLAAKLGRMPGPDDWAKHVERRKLLRFQRLAALEAARAARAGTGR